MERIFDQIFPKHDAQPSNYRKHPVLKIDNLEKKDREIKPIQQNREETTIFLIEKLEHRTPSVRRGFVHDEDSLVPIKSA